MQSHASRHVVSEHLKDRYPYQGPAHFPKVVIQDEIAEAYGRRSIPKLTEVLGLSEEELSDDDRVHCLKVLNSMLSTQEVKSQAIAAGTPPVLIHMLNSSASASVRRLCCTALESLAQILPGRQALEAASGIEALTAALKTTPDAAVRALRVFGGSAGGAHSLQRCPAGVVAALVELIGSPGTSFEACLDAAVALSALTTGDQGIADALASGVPRCLVVLSKRALRQDLTGNTLLLGVLHACARCLCELCSHPDGKAAVRAAEGIQALAGMLRAPSPAVVQHAAGALMAISIEPESKVPVMQHAGAALVALLKGNTPPPQADAAAGAAASDATAAAAAAAGDDAAMGSSAAANARAALRNVAEHLDARRKLELILPAAEAEQLLGQLPTVPPDYKYVVQAPLTAVPAMLAHA